tara:strand:- start:4717 stop:6051 length:1335 start_codon:yes stop_codon:yes gene_type:complete
MVETENKIQRYNKYKDSGARWLGKIPEHWKLVRSKRLFEVRKVRANKDDEQLTASQKYGVIPQIKYMELEGRKVTQVEFNPEILKQVKKGDFVISMRSFQGGIEFCNYDGCVSSAYVPLIPIKHIETSFFKYLFKSKSYISELSSTSNLVRDGQALRFDNFSQVDLLIIPLEEQTKIAQFLNNKTTKIDKAIAIKKQQINLLKERKQILIHKAVTRGLDDTVKLKDSGVKWIGEIPEHWEVKRFRYVFNLGKGLTITKDNLRDEGVFCVNYGEIHSKYGFEIDTNIHKLKCVEEEYLLSNPKALINKGDFVFADTSEDIEGSGNFTYLKSEDEIFAGYHTVIATPKFEIEARFFAYEFESESFRNQIRTKVKGVKVYSITQSILKEPTVWYPSKEEQIETVNFLDVETKKIDTAVSLKQQEIEKLKEYKSSLINDVVTGKVKVC